MGIVKHFSNGDAGKLMDMGNSERCLLQLTNQIAE